MVLLRSCSCFVPLLVVLAGCGGGDGVISAGGVLTHKGKPVASAMLTFTPENGRPSIGITDADGNFKLRYDRQREGVEVGLHTVSIEFKPQTNAELQAVQLQGKVTLSKELTALFDKYSHANSKHKVKVEAGTRQLKIDLD